MKHTELTDEPCPECGVSFNVVVTPPHGVRAAPDPAKPRPRSKTLLQERLKVCPTCGYTVPA